MYSYATVERSSEERDELILEHLPQVNWIATRIHEKLPPNVELDDLISAGIVGLLAAVDNFDPGRNTTLRTYAEYKIRGAILDSIRGLDGIPSHKRKRLKQVQQAIASAERKLQATPLDEDIAAELNISLAEYQQWMVDLRGVSLGSLQVVDGEEVDLLQFISDDEDETPARLLERAELERVVTDGMKKMPENERTVLSLYYKEELNLREIGSIMNLHTTRISQLRAQGILRLRSLVEHKWPTERGLY
ncbi:MAG TPA: FliA/WhiG family RNA polymerase sigma factor [Bryobacteraceae bacterium]|jgi:RNA polymerase sigma factor for flagellar operon FliA|nr:FliA/WhiG family RNA polymerase sigma factor [Bryobacteraceae bacterium]